MAKTTFIDTETVIEAEWLNEVNGAVFDAIGDGTNAPTTGAEVKTNIGAGDVDGPASSTDNAAARFNLATGKLIQDSVLVIADTTGSLSRTGNGGIPVQGTNTNDSAAAGYVGEYIESIVTSGSAVPLTSGIDTNITSISLAAGDWDVWGVAQFTVTNTTNVTQWHAQSSLVSATPDVDFQFRLLLPAYVPGATGNLFTFPFPTRRLSLSSTTTVYFVARANFTVSTQSAFGRICARRSR